MINGFSVDVEDWYHILDSPGIPHVSQWGNLESRLEQNLNILLQLLQDVDTKATFFWIGWLANKHKSLVRECFALGHEIANHSYHHVLPGIVGSELFANDIERGKKTLEDIIGERVLGFRVAGFGIDKNTAWALNLVRQIGHEYDSSIFEAARKHNSVFPVNSTPYFINTVSGPLLEIPIPAARLFNVRIFLFGGGYLRLAPRPLIRWGIEQLHRTGHPFIVYIHPRDLDPDQPRLPLGAIRRFRSYVNLKSTLPKLRWLLKEYDFVPMRELAKLSGQGTHDL